MPILIKQVSVQHAEHPILQDLSFELADGTITLLVGQTGAGKSSLLDVLTGLRPAHTGTVWYDEQPLWAGNRLSRAVQAQIGVVFQYPEHQLFARTVEKEFAYSLQALRLPKEEVQARTRTALRQMGLPEQIVNQSPLTLSGGQKRRVALGTTFATTPKWLFLDEPTAGLDPQSVQQLVDFLQEWRRQTQGSIVMATHDLDALFPLADRVLVLAAGRVVADATPQALCAQPELLQQARIGWPSSTQIAQSLRRHGLTIPAGPVAPAEMAQAIAQAIAQEKHMLVEVGVGQEAYQQPVRSFDDSSNALPVAKTGVATTNPQMESPTPQAPATEKTISLVHTLDPRAKWVFYLLFSLGILLQNGWLGLALTTVLTLAALLLARVPWQELWRLTKPYLGFIALSVLLSGLRIGETQQIWHIGRIGFTIAPALFTLLQLLKILLVMALSVILTTTTSQLRMKRGLEQSLAWLARIKIPVEAFSLAASLLLRFIPVIMKELERFSRITRARGKSTAKFGSMRLRDVNVIIIPLLISVLQLGEDLSLAMEARGYARIGLRRTSSIHLQMNRTDRLAMLCAVLLFLALDLLAK